jgi:NADH pyrophosphatase NudC (nudix superfamily)
LNSLLISPPPGEALPQKRFLLLQNNHNGKLCHGIKRTKGSASSISSATTSVSSESLFLTIEQLQIYTGNNKIIKTHHPSSNPNKLSSSSSTPTAFLHDLIQNHNGEIKNETTNGQIQSLLIWLGEYQDIYDDDDDVDNDDVDNDDVDNDDVDYQQQRPRIQYWAYYNHVDEEEREAISNERSTLLHDILIKHNNNNNNNNNNKLGQSSNYYYSFEPLREFGDELQSSQIAAIHALANGYMEFHKSHLFCSYCGSPTILQKSGASRLCSSSKRLKPTNITTNTSTTDTITTNASTTNTSTTNGGYNCNAPSIYPRIDVASIMLITSPCENYALLGRKASWPKGRYSTLAGFLEMGETIQDCCMRETWEESGVYVDPDSIQFVMSQPWPFPRSLMCGFRGKASLSMNQMMMVVMEKEVEIADGVPGKPSSTASSTASSTTTASLPKINFDKREMEDVQWFHRDYVAKRLSGGSTAIGYQPEGEEKEFHIPGKASLARKLIHGWVHNNQQ